MLYRANAADDWYLYPYQTRNIQGNLTDKRGIITIDTLELGEYALAVSDYLATGIQNPIAKTEVKGIRVFPNPSKTLLNVDLSDIKNNITANSMLIITDVTGKMILQEKIRIYIL